MTQKRRGGFGPGPLDISELTLFLHPCNTVCDTLQGKFVYTVCLRLRYTKRASNNKEINELKVVAIVVSHELVTLFAFKILHHLLFSVMQLQ